MIRIEAGMSTARFCRLIDMPERTWRRWQARTRAGEQARGPWPRPAREAALELAVKHALAHPAWGHRKIWAMVRHDGHVVSEATVLRILRDEGLTVREEPYAIDQWRADAESGALAESFACGTAAVVTPIGRVAGPGYDFTIGSGATGQTTARLLARLSDLQRGRASDPHGWLQRIA